MHGMGRRIVQVGPGLLRIAQRLRIPGVEIGTDVAGPACIYAVVQVKRGSVVVDVSQRRRRIPPRVPISSAHAVCTTVAITCD